MYFQRAVNMHIWALYALNISTSNMLSFLYSLNVATSTASSVDSLLGVENESIQNGYRHEGFYFVKNLTKPTGH